MKKTVSGALIVFFIFLFMHVTKPTSADFDDFIDERFDNTELQEAGKLQRFFQKGLNRSIAYQIKQTKQYEDKFIFALVNARELDEEVKYIGVLGMWFALS